MNNETVIFPDEALSAARDAGRALESARSLTITTPDEYRDAAEELKALSGRAKDVEKMRKDLKAPALEQCRRIDEFFAAPAKYLADAKAAIKRAIGNFEAEQRRIRDAEEKKQREAAARERERLQREAAKAEEQARIKREADEAKAAKLEAAGREAQAEVMRQQAIEREEQRLRESELKHAAAEAVPVQPVAGSESIKISGVSSRQHWRFEIIDEEKIPRDFLAPNEKLLGDYARAMKKNAKLPGVRFYAETIVTARSK